MAKCPACNRTFREGERFCPNGCQLGGASVQAPPSGQPQRAPAAAARIVTEPTSPPHEAESAREQRPLSVPPGSEDGRSKSKCKDITVWVNKERFFVQHVRVPFEFKIVSHVDDVTAIEIFLEAEDVHLSATIEECIEQGEECDLAIPFTPGDDPWGILSTAIYLHYVKGDRSCWYVAKGGQSQFHVYRQRERAQQAIESLNIDMRADIGHGQASDVQQRLDNLDALRPKEDDPVSDLVSIDLPPDWQELAFKKLQKEPDHLKHLEPLDPAVITDELSLFRQDKRIHLLSGRVIQIGKNRRCDIVTRNFDGRGRAAEIVNERIGRFHCQIQVDRCQVLLADYGVNPEASGSKPSQNGTFLDRSRIPRGQRVPLPLNKSFSIQLAGDDDSQDQVFGLRGKISTREDWVGDERPAAMVMHRTDDIPEAFVVVWDSVDMGKVDSELKGLVIAREDDGFRSRYANHRVWLAPAKTLKIKNGEVKVLKKQQFYL